MNKEWLRNNWRLCFFMALIVLLIVSYAWTSIFEKSLNEMDSYNPNLIPEEKYYPLKKFSGGSTENNKNRLFETTPFRVNSNKIKLVVTKGIGTEILSVCIDSLNYNAPILNHNCVHSEGNKWDDKEWTEFPQNINKKYRYIIMAVTDGDWKAEVFEYRK